MSRKEDIRIEGVCGRFLDQHLFSRINGYVKRNTDRELQYRGVDVSISSDVSGNWVIDEKVKYFGCTNKALDCLSFEITRINQAGYRDIGWYASSRQLTNAYYFISPFLEKGDQPSDIVDSNLTATQVLIVQKDKVEKFVKDNGYSTMDIMQLAEELAQMPYWKLDKKGKVRKILVQNKLWLTYSSNLDEEPVNLVIPRSELKKLPGVVDIYITKKSIIRK